MSRTLSSGKAAGASDRGRGSLNRRAMLGAGVSAATLALIGESESSASAHDLRDVEERDVLTVVHTDRRLEVKLPVTYENAVARFERGLPPLPAHSVLVQQVEIGGRAGLAAYLDSLSPDGLFLFFKVDGTAIMNLLGHSASSDTYIVGNPSIAERMYGYNSGILHYAPMRMTLQEDHLGQVRFLIDRPSVELASFGDPRITEVGRYLDKKVGGLLARIGFPVPAALK